MGAVGASGGSHQHSISQEALEKTKLGDWSSIRAKSKNGRVSVDIVNHKTCDKIKHAIVNFFKSALEGLNGFNIVPIKFARPEYTYGEGAQATILQQAQSIYNTIHKTNIENKNSERQERKQKNTELQAELLARLEERWANTNKT